MPHKSRIEERKYEALLRIDSGLSRLRGSEKECTYTYLPEDQIAAQLRNFLGHRVVRDPDYQRTDNSSEYAVAAEVAAFFNTYSETRALGLLRSFRWSTVAILQNLFIDLKRAADDGNLLVFFFCARSIIEKTGVLVQGARKIKEVEEAHPDRSACDKTGSYLSEVQAEVGNVFKQNRFDWKKFAVTGSIRVDEKLKPGAPSEYESVYKPEQVLNDIDLMSREILGLRNLYEISCEFVHANYGHSILFIDADSISTIRHEVVVRRRVYSFDSHSATLDQLAGLLVEALEILGELINPIGNAVDDLKKHESSVSAAVRSHIRSLISLQPYLFAVGDMCPCFSGKAIEKCCAKGKKKKLGATYSIKSGAQRGSLKYLHVKVSGLAPFKL